MPQVRREIIKDRARRLREKSQAALGRHLQAQIGARRQVLVESAELGRTEHFTPVRLARAAKAGALATVTIASHDGYQLMAA
jgi:threonylcarbamoyladenosine tRNA methylthiotransferase MtaB